LKRFKVRRDRYIILSEKALEVLKEYGKNKDIKIGYSQVRIKKDT